MEVSRLTRASTPGSIQADFPTKDAGEQTNHGAERVNLADKAATDFTQAGHVNSGKDLRASPSPAPAAYAVAGTMPLAAAYSEDKGCRNTMEDVCVLQLDARPGAGQPQPQPQQQQQLVNCRWAR